MLNYFKIDIKKFSEYLSVQHGGKVPRSAWIESNIRSSGVSKNKQGGFNFANKI
jgi:hypothetical protein